MKEISGSIDIKSMKSVKYYCPGSLSFIFRKIENRSYYKTGSLGVGCTINKGVVVKLTNSKKFEILFNNKPIDFPTVSFAYHELTHIPVTINITAQLPLGYGFGISASSTLASIFALNKLLSLGKSTKFLIRLAHKAEIINRTGLGSIGTQIVGGLLVKKTSGIPFSYKILPFEGKYIYATVIGKMETPAVLGNKKQMTLINKVSDEILRQIFIQKIITLDDIFEYSLDFVKKSGLLINNDVADLINSVRDKGGHATMSILGDVVLSTIPASYKTFSFYKLKISNDNIFTNQHHV